MDIPVGICGSALEQDGILKRGEFGVAGVRQFNLHPYSFIGFWLIFPLSLGFQGAIF
tara:strand:- start:130 stop:300 length:171 start_codon:yes stop_codon:yes gene_type:complete